MKGFTPLVLGIFATLAFSWLGLAYIPDLQIGHLDPQSDEEGTDIYPMPKSGMAERGRRIYVANGCFYCHSEQVRADYAASDIDRARDAAPSPPSKWGDRRRGTNRQAARAPNDSACTCRIAVRGQCSTSAGKRSTNRQACRATIHSDGTCGVAARHQCLAHADKRHGPTKRQASRATVYFACTCCIARASRHSSFACCLPFGIPGALLRCLAPSTSLCAAQSESRFRPASLQSLLRK